MACCSMALVIILTQMEISSGDNIKMGWRMALDMIFIQMETSFMVSIIKERDMGMEFFSFQTVKFIAVNLKMISLMATAIKSFKIIQ